jgi:flagellar motility protein MotE (MotC chaperone)
MRLLEFGLDDGGANPVAARQPSRPEAAKPFRVPEAARAVPSPSGPAASKPQQNSSAPAKKARVYPLKTAGTPTNLRKPIDLEQLQQRIVVLEQRIKARSEALGDEVAARDLAQLKQRMKLLEHNINNELWAAKQREYNMLQMMAKPTLKTALKQGYAKLKSKTAPAVLASLVGSYRYWWLNSQPGWWQGFMAAWHESLDKARGQTRY